MVHHDGYCCLSVEQKNTRQTTAALQLTSDGLLDKKDLLLSDEINRRRFLTSRLALPERLLTGNGFEPAACLNDRWL